MNRPDCCLVDCVLCALVAQLQSDRLDACHDADWLRSVAANTLLRRIDGEVQR